MQVGLDSDRYHDTSERGKIPLSLMSVFFDMLILIR
nr:MAG TPA: hypothetical protein [Caudoviricetes sp.]